MFDSILDFLPMVVFAVFFILNNRQTARRRPAPRRKKDQQNGSVAGKTGGDDVLFQINDKLKKDRNKPAEDRLYIENKDKRNASDQRDTKGRIRGDGRLMTPRKEVRTDNSSVLRREGRLRYDGAVIGDRKQPIRGTGDRERDGSRIYRDGRDLLIAESEIGGTVSSAASENGAGPKRYSIGRKELLQGVIMEQILGRPKAL